MLEVTCAWMLPVVQPNDRRSLVLDALMEEEQQRLRLKEDPQCDEILGGCMKVEAMAAKRVFDTLKGGTD